MNLLFPSNSVILEVGNAGGEAAAAIDDPFTTDEDTVKSGNVLTNDSNPESRTLEVIQVNGVETNVGQQLTLPSGALLTVNADASFTYDPNDQFETLNDGESWLDSFTYSIDDGYGIISSATVSMSVAGITDAPPNLPPVAVDDAVTTQKNEAITINVLDNDSDADGGTLVIESVDISNSDGTAAIVNGEISYTPAANSLTTDTFNYTISDGQGGTGTATVTVRINPTEDEAPSGDDPTPPGPPFAD